MSEKDDVTKANEAKEAAVAARKAAEKQAADAKAAQEEAERKLTAAETARQAAERKADTAARKGLPDLERVQAELEAANKQIEELTAERDKGFQDRDGEIAKRDESIRDMERGAWVRAAAGNAGFHDVEDAVLRVKLADLDTPEKAEAAVKQLAEGSKHLVKTTPEPTSTDILRQVLKDGKVPGAEGDKDKQVIDPAQFNAMTQDQHVELMETQPELYDRSLAAASADTAEPAAA